MAPARTAGRRPNRSRSGCRILPSGASVLLEAPAHGGPSVGERIFLAGRGRAWAQDVLELGLGHAPRGMLVVGLGTTLRTTLVGGRDRALQAAGLLEAAVPSLFHERLLRRAGA